MTAPASTRRIGCAILLDTSGNLLLQQRDDIPTILQPGKIALFGGHCEDGETCLQCAVREIHEEISYPVSAGQFELLARYRGADIDVPENTTGTLDCEIFLVRDIPLDKLVITEGTLFIIAPGDLARIETKLAPLARFALAEFERQRGK